MLSGFRMLDLADETGFICSKVFADLGADVIRIEKPGGDLARSRGPFWHDIPEPQKSLFWAAYNAGKRSITLDIETSDGQELFKQVVKSADFVLESFPPGHMDALGLGYEVLSKINPRIILTSVTPFGQSGPYRDYTATEMVVSALGGLLYLVGDEDSAPVHTDFPLSVYVNAGFDAAIGTLIAHYYCARTGEGQHVDVSAQQAIEWLTVYAASNWEMNQTILSRKGPAMQWAQGEKRRVHWRCKDGYVAFAVFPQRSAIKSARNLAEWMRSEGFETGAFGEADWETMHLSRLTEDEIKQIEEPVSVFFASHSVAELYSEALKRQLLLAPLMTTKDLVDSPQLEALNYWRPVEEPGIGGVIRYPTLMHSSETDVGVRSRTAFIGEHNREVYIHELGLSEEQLVALKESQVI